MGMTPQREGHMAIHIRRLDFIVTLGSAAAAFPLAARAQAPDIPVVGFLHAGHKRPRAVASFQKGLAEGGYVADRNVAFDFRWADEEFDRLPELAADLVRRNVAVIAAFGNAAARAAKAATATIPIAFASSSDPVAVGLVSSLNRPGWNVTGVTILNQELESTRLERLVQVVPHATTIAFLVNPDSVTADPKLREMENAAHLLDRRLQVFPMGASKASSIRPSSASSSSGSGRWWSPPTPCSPMRAQRSAARLPGMQCRRWAPIAILRAPAA